MTDPDLGLQQPMPVRAGIASVEWLFEPAWPGVRLLVRVTGGRPSVIVADGPEPDDVAPLLAAAVRGHDVVLDGVWTTLEADGAFVAIDLLELDGEELLDVPFQERRRLLESVIVEGERVRVGPVVKHPVAGWLGTWRGAGFTHYFARHQNARYVPGGQSDDWLMLELPVRGGGGGGLLGHLVGERGRGRRIAD